MRANLKQDIEALAKCSEADIALALSTILEALPLSPELRSKCYNNPHLYISTLFAPVILEIEALVKAAEDHIGDKWI